MSTLLLLLISSQFLLGSGKGNSISIQQDSALMPSGDTVTIDTGDDFTGYCQLIISDIGDHFVLKKKMHAKHGLIKIKVDFLKPGVYFFEVNEPVKVRKHKILKA